MYRVTSEIKSTLFNRKRQIPSHNQLQFNFKFLIL